MIRFDARFAVARPSEFVDEVLVGRSARAASSVGENFRFGAGAQGDPALLAADRRFATRVVALREQ